MMNRLVTEKLISYSKWADHAVVNNPTLLFIFLLGQNPFCAWETNAKDLDQTGGIPLLFAYFDQVKGSKRSGMIYG